MAVSVWEYITPTVPLGKVVVTTVGGATGDG